MLSRAESYPPQLSCAHGTQGPTRLHTNPIRRVLVREGRDFLKAADASRYRAFWYLFAFTGMRPGELLALTRADVDLAQLTVTVSKRLYEIPTRFRTSPEEKWDVDEPKTENAEHEVGLPQHIVPILARHLSVRRLSRGRWAKLLFQTQTDVEKGKDGHEQRPWQVEMMKEPVDPITKWAQPCFWSFGRDCPCQNYVVPLGYGA